MERINRLLHGLADKQWPDRIDLTEWEVRRAYYVKPGEYRFMEEAATGPIPSFLTGTSGTTYFLKRSIRIPETWAGGPVGLIFESGGEGLLRLNGAAYHGLDANHTYVPLFPEKSGTEALIEIELFDPIPEPADPLNRQASVREPIRSVRSLLVKGNRAVQKLVHSLTIVRDTALRLEKGDGLRQRLMEALYEAMDRVEGLRMAGGAPEDEAWDEVERALSAKVGRLAETHGTSGVMHMVGQSHIDVAWLWPVRETVRKAGRTFSTVCTLMEEYPDFKYAQSQPQLYAFVKEREPELYARIKDRVAEGRWEPVGGMWVEPDLNLPGGESLIRQLLYGQRFYREEFGRTAEIEWLPDTFGYCASLPQILRHAGIRFFMTSKLNWNDTNPFPYDLFHWTGIDGTSVLTFLNHGLNEHTKPKDIGEHWDSFRQKDRHDEQMLLYGHGDGGGGVTREMADRILRPELMPGLPRVRFSSAADFFRGVEERRPELPEWHGDLYLELHRGTYTTQARNKRWNRKAEVLYREAEVWNSLGLAMPNAASERRASFKEAMGRGWKLILLNQFHDIIPGSSIPEVYETSAKEYEEAFAIGTEELERGLSALAGQPGPASSGGGDQIGDDAPYLVFNSLGWEREEIVELGIGPESGPMAAYDAGGSRLAADAFTDAESGERKLAVRVPSIPAFGCKSVWLRPEGSGEALTAEYDTPVKAVPELRCPGSWVTDWYEIGFNEQGEIIRWYDRTARRELLQPGAKANEFCLFHDKPTEWDAWDIDPRFERQRAGRVRLRKAEAVRSGDTHDLLRFEWELNDSVIRQDMVLYRHDRRVDFRTEVLWAESHKLLKISFAFDLIAVKAAYEIPFGSVERTTHRNTSWEQAQFEVCGHRWADVSEGGYGVSLLNDCKYGHDIRGGTMRLSLLRAPSWPDAEADRGRHAFTYAVYPHEGDWRGAGTVRKAAELNGPAAVVKAGSGLPTEGGTAGPGGHSFLGLDSRHVILDAVKPSEDGEDTILRFYESSGGRERVAVEWKQPFRRVMLVDALEQEEREIPAAGGRFVLDFRPYEIKSVKIIR